MVKKILRITGIILVVLVLALIAIPYFFKDEIKAKIEQTINDNLDAKVSFADADLSLFKSFPSANVSINKLVIINKAPFEGDTLVSLGELNLKMSIGELFHGKDKPMSIEGISSKNSVINIIFNQEGLGNFDIALKDKKDKDPSKSDPMLLKIKNYKIDNLRFSFKDEKSKMKMVLDSIYHEGTGDFTATQLDLVTNTTAKVSVDMDKINYMKKVKLSLDATLGIDMAKNKYSFKNNKAKINELPLEFNGFIQMIDAGQVYDLTFKTPTSSFKNFLGLIPAAFSKGIENVKTTGNFTVNGVAKGTYSKTSVPKFNIEIASEKASFQYPNLPKAITNITIDTKIINETGVLNDTYVNLNQLSFQIDQDVFNAKATIKNITQNAQVEAALKGIINLANVSKAYPVKLDKPLTGILKADVTTSFDMASVEKNEYQNIKNAGTVSLTGFKYSDDKGKNMNINNALVVFNPSQVNLKQFQATTGKSDMNLTGTLDNFYGFMFKKQELKGNFNIVSNQIVVADFMTADEPAKKEVKKPEALKIPAFLNCTLTAKANTVLYDNLALKNFSGKLSIKEEKVAMENVKISIFEGTIGANGSVSTKEKTPTFDMNLAMNQVDINQTFTQLEMMKKIAPIAEIINGKLNANIKVGGKLDPLALSPDTKTISGDIMGQMQGTSINADKSTLLKSLGGNMKFLDLKKLNLNDVKIAASFKDGRVIVKPFDLKYQDLKATVGGTHGFDQTLSYNLKMDVPAKYLGNEGNAILAKLSPNDLGKLKSIPLNATITGTFSKPSVSSDMKSALTALATQTIKNQAGSLIGNFINKNKKAGDTTKTAIPTTKEEIKTQAKEEVKSKAKDLLNGWLNKK